MSIATTDLNLEKGCSSNHSDTSSDETDRRRPTETPAAVGRSYECTFCKRGFTNAQALGGHMNIHRKDKLKAKKHPSISIPQQQQQQGSSPSPNSKSSHHHLFTSSRAVAAAQHVGYLFYPSYRQPIIQPNDGGLRPGNLGLHGDLMEANLTLRIGEDGEEESKEELEKNDEVDLELRLGHHKYSS